MGQPTYQELLAERDWLRNRIRELEEENARLKGELGYDIPVKKQEPSAMLTLSLQEKIDLFRGLFKGREDVFARRWYSRTTGKAGYQPVCSNEWDHQLCNKKKFKCAECPNRQFSPLTDGDFYKHLSGKDEEGRDVIGVYAIMDDNTCNFLCADFDDKNCEHGYQKDVLAFTAICKQWQIPFSIECSRSGKGAHVWVFFETPVPAVKTRRLGNVILTEAMSQDVGISFKSYDRFIPNQDYLPQGGFGNLIALPLQGKARKNGNSIFVDEDFQPYSDQWEYLLSIRKLSEVMLDGIVHRFGNTLPMGELSTTSESKPWEVPVAPQIAYSDFGATLSIIKANMLFIPTKGVSAKILNHFKRIASFKNPEFYSTFNSLYINICQFAFGRNDAIEIFLYQHHSPVDQISENCNKFAVVLCLEILPCEVVVLSFRCICREYVSQHILLTWEIQQIFMQPHCPVA